MKTLPISNKNNSAVQFKRKPNAEEVTRYTKALSQGLKVLDKELGVIVHNSTVPSIPKKNLGIGSLLSKSAEKMFIPFLAMNAITAIQQEPDTHKATYDVSPYAPQAMSKNIYMAPIERFATDEYAHLVSKEDIQAVIDNNAKRENSNRVDYSQVAKDYDYVLSIAYNNLVTEQDELMQFGLEKTERQEHLKLLNEFDEFKKEKYQELEPMAIFEILTKKNNHEDWKKWEEHERNLYNPANENNIEKYRNIYGKKIDFYMFKQWFVEREIEKANARNKELGISVIGDSPVAFTAVEVWQNQDLFMDDYALGCPDGQRWGFAVLKPETIFNSDGSLGKGGELLKKRYEKMFEAAPGGVRIDHVIGLIDPFVYSVHESKTIPGQNSDRLYTSNLSGLSKYHKKADNNYRDYASILEKIIIPAAEKYGLTKDNIICEDLGEVTEPVRNVMRELGLGGISVTQYGMRGKYTAKNATIMAGSHDNESILEYTDRMFSPESRGSLEYKSNYLAEDTSVTNENVNDYREQIKKDKTKFLAASFAELFTSPAKKVQLFFTSLFGMNETYNRFGTTENVWTLRVPEDYDNLYWNNVKNGTAPNFPEAIARAIRNRGWDFANQNKDLLTTLDEFTQILKS